MREETIKIYKFEELSGQAKEVAREWWRRASDGDTSDFDFCIEGAVRLAGLMGIEISSRSWTNSYGFKGSTPEIHFSGFYSQGDGASFEGTYRYQRGALAAIRAEAPATWVQKRPDGAISYGESTGNAELHRIARALQRAQAKHFYGITTRVTQSGHYSHSNTMQFRHSLNIGDHYEDYYESDATEQIEEALRDFADWIYGQLEAEYDYHNSDEYIDETIIANEYEFTADGGIA